MRFWKREPASNETTQTKEKSQKAKLCTAQWTPGQDKGLQKLKVQEVKVAIKFCSILFLSPA